MTPNCTAEELAAGCSRICETYLQAPRKWVEEGVKTLSVDEKTGIQALQRIAEDLPMEYGKNRKQEFEYTRHGTQCLTANWDIVNGGILSPTIGLTRTEEDFVAHIKQTVTSDSGVAKWCFVSDQLNTHQSEGLVRWIASLLGEEIDLGDKGKRGILKDMESRAAFLTNPEHPVYFVYTPKHCSWLNQVEIWFGILSRKLLRYGNFKSVDNLKEQILNFIDYFNKALAKPFKWTFNGKPLCS
jgi:putative transposase